MDSGHNHTESLLSILTRRISTRYNRTNKALTKQITPMLEEMVLDDESATATQRVKYARKHGLDKITQLVTESILDTTESAWEDMGAVFDEVYRVNFRYMAKFFKDKANVDIESEDEK